PTQRIERPGPIAPRDVGVATQPSVTRWRDASRLFFPKPDETVCSWIGKSAHEHRVSKREHGGCAADSKCKGDQHRERECPGRSHRDECAANIAPERVHARRLWEPSVRVSTSVYLVRCPLSAVRCPLSAVRCPLSAVRCPLSRVRCRL